MLKSVTHPHLKTLGVLNYRSDTHGHLSHGAGMDSLNVGHYIPNKIFLKALLTNGQFHKHFSIIL